MSGTNAEVRRPRFRRTARAAAAAVLTSSAVASTLLMTAGAAQAQGCGSSCQVVPVKGWVIVGYGFTSQFDCEVEAATRLFSNPIRCRNNGALFGWVLEEYK